MFCFLFLLGFFLRWRTRSPKKDYLVGESRVSHIQTFSHWQCGWECDVLGGAGVSCCGSDLKLVCVVCRERRTHLSALVSVTIGLSKRSRVSRSCSKLLTGEGVFLCSLISIPLQPMELLEVRRLCCIDSESQRQRGGKRVMSFPFVHFTLNRRSRWVCFALGAF